MAKSYYAILGVDAGATATEIKAAYRRRALELHPDRSRGSRRPFQELLEAYRVLSDAAQRRRYDAALAQEAQRRRNAAARRPAGYAPEPLIPRRARARAVPADWPEPLDPFDSFDRLCARLWAEFFR